MPVRKRLCCVLLVLVALTGRVGVSDAGPPSDATYDPARFGDDVEWATKTLGADALFLLTGPFRIERGDLVPLTLGVAALGAGFGLDHAVREEAKHHHRSLRDATEGINYLGNAGVLLGLNVGFLAVGEGIRQYDGTTRYRDAALVATEAQALTLGLSAGLKTAIGRSRPRAGRGPHDFEPFGSDASFPSNHASQAFAVATVLADRFGWEVGTLSYGAASLVGLSRVALDKHWTSDVVAGALLGTLVGHALSVRHATAHGFLDFAPFVDRETRTYGLSLHGGF